MGSRETLWGCGGAFLLLAIWAYSQREWEESVKSELRAYESVRQQYQAMQASVQADVERSKALEKEVAEDLQLEEREFSELQNTLTGLEKRLDGTQSLREAVSELRAEYEGLKGDLARTRRARP